MNIARWLSSWSLNRRLRQLERQTASLAARSLAKHGVKKRRDKVEAVRQALEAGGTVTVPSDTVVGRPWPVSRYRFER